MDIPYVSNVRDVISTMGDDYSKKRTRALWYGTHPASTSLRDI